MNNGTSWNAVLKTELCGAETKRQCCRRALVFGLLYGAQRLENGDVVLAVPECAEELARKLIHEQFTREAENVGSKREKILLRFNSRAARIMLEKQGEFSEYIKCAECTAEMLRGIFISVGSMNSPEKECYLQLMPADAHACYGAKEIAEKVGISFSVGERRGKSYLYVKRRDVIESFLGLLGANNSYFDFLNAGIGKQTLADANRAANCITRNISKTVNAAKNQLELIKSVQEADRLSILPPELAETARLRLEYPDSSLASLAAHHNPPVSKSGLYHRLEKITEILTEDRKKRSGF